jgi:L-asparaginase
MSEDGTTRNTPNEGCSTPIESNSNTNVHSPENSNNNHPPTIPENEMDETFGCPSDAEADEVDSYYYYDDDSSNHNTSVGLSISPKILHSSRKISVNTSALRLDQLYHVPAFEQIRPKVLVLFSGGTLIMRESEDGGLVVNDKDIAMQFLLERLEPRIAEIANISMTCIENIDSSNMSPRLWDLMGKTIAEQYDNYDGFVITHGTDTMAYTASALSFVLGDLGKPVVLTGAQIPGGRIETDARRNFVNAVRIATLNKAGTVLCFDGDIILGARSHKLSESKLDACGPINWGLYGEIRIDIHFSDDAKDRHDRPLQFQPGFEENIVIYTLFPGFPPRDIENSIRSGVKGIILRGYGSGNISYKYLEVVKLARDRLIPVVVNTQCLEGATLMHLYDVGRKALNLGVIQAYDMSMECCATKLMWAIHHADSYEHVRTIMHTNYVGEVNKEGKLYGNPR